MSVKLSCSLLHSIQTGPLGYSNFGVWSRKWVQWGAPSDPDGFCLGLASAWHVALAWHVRWVALPEAPGMEVLQHDVSLIHTWECVGSYRVSASHKYTCCQCQAFKLYNNPWRLSLFGIFLFDIFDSGGVFCCNFSKEFGEFIYSNVNLAYNTHQKQPCLVVVKKPLL